MKRKDLVALLNRAAAALETPADLTDEERLHVVEDLVAAAESFEGGDDVRGILGKL